MYSMLNETHSMKSGCDGLSNSWISYSFPILSGKGAKNNRLIFKTLALNGPLSKYELSKILTIQYPTIHRRVDALRKLNYLDIADKRIQKKRPDQKTFLYSLTWKGLIVSIQIEDVRARIVEVFRNCPLLNFPEKEKILDLINSYEILTPEDTIFAVELVYEAFLIALPMNFESLSNERLLNYFFQSIMDTNYEQKYYDVIDHEKVKRILKHSEFTPTLQKYLDYLDYFIGRMNRTKEKIYEII